MDIALSNYVESLEYLFARTTGSFKFGLERTTALLAELGNPHLAYPVLHIAGTNGKGSSVATADALLRARGLRVARYTSPHLVDFRERMVVNGEPIDEESIVQFIAEHTPAVERIGASFFEATTALAFLHFARCNVDVALIETGLGGRLDSTNVVQPVAAGVTAIGFDHMEYLGPSLQAIASEKAGIFKRGVAAVIGEPDAVIRHQLARAAEAAGASAVRVVAEEMQASDVALTGRGTRFNLRALGDERIIETPLVGIHQAANFAFTLALLDAAGDPFRVTLAEAAANLHTVRLPGRFQRVGKWIFDVAHNPDGARTVAGSMALIETEHPVVAVMCVLGDKDWRAMMDALAPVVDEFILTNAPTAPESRAWSLAEAREYASAMGYFATAADKFDVALADADARGRTVLVTGSFHTVGDAMARLQVSPLTG
ncbi:MAG: FolC bifunctional protein [Gemmatimonadetes bacterium]|nr:FolC bifunctional protein [Gemmatimonadota bacterium]